MADENWAATRRTALGLPLAAMAGLIFGRGAYSGLVEERRDLQAIFGEHNASGTFVLYEPATDKFTVVDAARAERRYVPASTFKIPNSIIALETGVIRDENDVIPYGGKPQPIKAWEADMPIREAIAVSNVPVYQELARRIGLEKYREWLDRLDYGNRELGTVVDRFWLDGPLEISAMEQVKFVAQLAQGKLNASARSQSIVRDILRLESKDGSILYGKTGWDGKIGWWTGWVERGSHVSAFALNMDLQKSADAPKRTEIGKILLQKLNAW